MKKKFIAAMAVAVVAVVTGYNVYSSQKSVTMSDLALANVEALASDESGSVDCCNTCKGSFCGTFYPSGSMSGISMYYKI